MTVLSAQSIRKYVKIEPFDERAVHSQTGMSYGLSSCGYDVTLDQAITLYSGNFKLGSIQQYINMPNNIKAVVHDKSSLARQGLSVFNTVIEPGWHGYLTVELVNHSDNVLYLKRGQPIAQIIFEWLDEPTEQPYNGKYQNQPNRPVEAIRES